MIFQNVCEKEVTDIASHFWKLIKNINKTPGNKLFGDYAVFLIVFISLIIWIPCSIFVSRRDKKMVENKKQEAPIEYVRGTVKLHRQDAIKPGDSSDHTQLTA